MGRGLRAQGRPGDHVSDRADASVQRRLANAGTVGAMPAPGGSVDDLRRSVRDWCATHVPKDWRDQQRGVSHDGASSSSCAGGAAELREAGLVRAALARGVGWRVLDPGAGRHRRGARARAMRPATRCTTSPCSTWRPRWCTAPRRSSGSGSCPAILARRGVVPGLSRSPMPVPTSRVCRRAPCATATTTSSTARRCGRAGRTRPTGACSSPAPTPTRRSTRASAA